MDELERLRQLLGIAEDRAAVDHIEERVKDRESRTRDVAEVLPEAVKRAAQGGRLTPSLEAPIERTLRKSITRDPKAFADVLFPAMGPAIRRSIAEALRSALEGLNRAMEYGFSVRGLRWRLEAWRTGVPFREVVLRHTMAYRVREAFLISKRSGLLMVRAGEAGREALDRDAVAAMLTAIENFVADSTGDDGGELVSAELGGHVLWVLSGYAARLALVVEGQPPRSVRTRLQENLERIHGRRGSWMESFDGSAEPDEELIGEVASCLMWETVDSAGDQRGEKSSRFLRAGIVLGLGAALLLAWLIWSVVENRQDAARWARLETLLADRPGLVYLNADREDGRRRISLLADPGAERPEELARQAGFETDEIQWSIHRFQSAEPELVAARLRQALAPIPAGVSITADDVVTVAGEAPADWIDRLRQYVGFQSQPEQFRLSLRGAAEQDLIELLGTALAPPEGVSVEFAGNGSVRISGLAAGRWRTRAEATLAEDFSAVAVDWSGFEDARARLEATSQRLAEHAAYFEPEQSANPNFATEPIAVVVREIQGLAALCDCRVELTAVGCSDSSGPATLNESLRAARAAWLRDKLLDLIPGAGPMTLATDCSGTGEKGRRAYLRLELADR